MSINKVIGLCLLSLLACGCERQRSDVPSYPVQFEMDLQQYPYVTRFVAGGGFQTVAITRTANDLLQLQFPNDTLTMVRREGDYVGYAGLLVWSDIESKFHAADLCCPHCLNQAAPVQIDGAFAICPTCGETFDLMSGYALPTKGITKQTLRRFDIYYQNWKIIIRN